MSDIGIRTGESGKMVLYCGPLELEVENIIAKCQLPSGTVLDFNLATFTELDFSFELAAPQVIQLMGVMQKELQDVPEEGGGSVDPTPEGGGAG